MRWDVHGERSLYESDWMSLRMVDVEVPGGPRFDHHVLRLPHHAAGTVVYDARTDCVLLLWRHRFITDSWGWEIPAGNLDAGETPAAGAAREALEETGWAPRGLRPLASYHPMPGAVDQTFHLFTAAGADRRGAPTDPGESERVEWVPVAEVRAALTDGRITEGLSLTALALALLRGVLDGR